MVTIQQDTLKNAVDIPIKQERSFSKALFKKTFDAEINLKENIITNYDNLMTAIENLKAFKIFYFWYYEKDYVYNWWQWWQLKIWSHGVQYFVLILILLWEVLPFVTLAQ